MKDPRPSGVCRKCGNLLWPSTGAGGRWADAPPGTLVRYFICPQFRGVPQTGGCPPETWHELLSFAEAAAELAALLADLA